MTPNINQEDIQRFMLVLKGCRPRYNYGKVRNARFEAKDLIIKQMALKCIQNQTRLFGQLLLPYPSTKMTFVCYALKLTKMSSLCDHYNFQIQVTGSASDN